VILFDLPCQKSYKPNQQIDGTYRNTVKLACQSIAVKYLQANVHYTPIYFAAQKDLCKTTLDVMDTEWIPRLITDLS